MKDRKPYYKVIRDFIGLYEIEYVSFTEKNLVVGGIDSITKHFKSLYFIDKNRADVVCKKLNNQI